MPTNPHSIGQESKVRLVIVDDHPLFRNGLKQVIEADPHFQLLAEAGDGQTALDQISRLKPDVAVVDIHLPDFGGLELVQKLRLRRLNCRVVILTMYKDEDLFNRALNLGAVGYLLKESAVSEIASCLRAAAREGALHQPGHFRICGAPPASDHGAHDGQPWSGPIDHSRAAHLETHR